MEIGAGVLAQDQADAAARREVGGQLIGQLVGWSVPIGYFLYELLLQPFLAR